MMTQQNQLRPSSHFVRYDAQTYEKQGFIQVSGRVCKLAEKPRFWQITATAKTQDPTTGEVQKKHFKFKTNDRFRLNELAPIVNERIHEDDDFLPDCLSVMVCARVML